MNTNGINNFFFIQFQITNRNNMSDVLNDELFYPYNSNSWCNTYTYLSFSKNILINANRLQNELQKLLMKRNIQ